MSYILTISEKYWPYGGAELATHLILKLLRDEGFSITVMTGMKNIERISGIQYTYYPLLDVPSKIYLWARILGSDGQLKELVKRSEIVYIPRVAYPIIPLAKKYDKKVIVHLHNYQPVTYCSVIPYPYNVDDSSIFHDISRSARFEVLENGSVIKSILSSLMTPLNGFVKSWIAKADEVICVSKRQAEIVRCELPKLANKVRVIYNPLPDVSLIEKYLNKPTFLYVGGDSYYKGFHIFLKATANLLHNEHGVKFLLAGNFRDKNRGIISSLNKKFGGPYKIVGWLPHKELLKLHSGVCGLIFPSILEEPLPYAVAESMLAGTIPIVSRVGGVPEIVQGTYAEKMIFTPGDIDELVDRIEEALSLSKDQLTDIGASLRESILRKFDTEDIKRRLLDVFT